MPFDMKKHQQVRNCNFGIKQVVTSNEERCRENYVILPAEKMPQAKYFLNGMEYHFSVTTKRKI
jgi:hypothetical protein